MSVDVLVTDTHPLVWYVTEQHRKLSRRVRSVFDKAVSGDAVVWIPAVVLWECSLLIRAGRIKEVKSLDRLLPDRFDAQALVVFDLTQEDVVTAHRLSFTEDPFDTMIVAMAMRKDCPLITKDEVITTSKVCDTYW